MIFKFKSILDPTFEYTPAVKTDLRKTFERVRRELEKAAQLAEAERALKVAPIFARKVGP